MLAETILNDSPSWMNPGLAVIRDSNDMIDNKFNNNNDVRLDCWTIFNSFVQTSGKCDNIRCVFIDGCFKAMLDYCKTTADILNKFESEVMEKISVLERKLAGLSSKSKSQKELKSKMVQANADLNHELSQTMRENEDLFLRVEQLREDVIALRRVRHMKSNNASNDFFGPENLKGQEDRLPQSTSLEVIEEQSEVVEDELVNSYAESLDRSSSASGSSSSSPLDSSESADNLRTKLQILTKEVVKVKEHESELIEEIVLKDRALADAEGRISEIQNELETNKAECYGHMKVIEQLKKSNHESTGEKGRFPDSPSSKVKTSELALAESLVKANAKVGSYKERLDRVTDDLRYFLRKYRRFIKMKPFDADLTEDSKKDEFDNQNKAERIKENDAE